MRRTLIRSLIVAGAILILLPGLVAATPLSPAPGLQSQAQGLAIAEAGVGLETLGSGTANLTIGIGGDVQQAFLYWAGLELDGCPQGECFDPPNSPPFGDQQLIFDGNPITGSIVGREDQINSGIGYKADVTSVVATKGSGLQSFTIQDGNTSNNLDRLNGAGLLVLYTDSADLNFYRVVVLEGFDSAYGVPSHPFPDPDNFTTNPATFNFQSETGARQADLIVFAGDAEAGRPDRIDITDNSSIFNQLDSSDGNSWDTDKFTIGIPAGISSTTVQLLSAPPDQNPDSLLWIVGALRVPVAAPGEGCTPGYWKNHTESWPPTGYSTGQTLEDVFDVPNGLGMDSTTLHKALDGGGGSGLTGAAKILFRAGVAALLNGAHPGVDYEQTDDEVIDAVNTALASNDRDTMLSLASTLDAQNNRGCPLN